jgi:methionyl aminopeptidase
MFELKSEREIEIMREAGRIVAEVLDLMEKHIAPGPYPQPGRYAGL